MKNKWLILIVTMLAIVTSFIVSISIFSSLEKECKCENNTVSEVIIEEKETIAPLVEKANAAVFLVETFSGESLTSTGTAFSYKQDGDKTYIMTNHHVINVGDRILLTSYDGRTYEPDLLGSDEFSDIAILKVVDEGLDNLIDIGSSEESRLGDTLFSIGSPLGRRYINTVTRGILSGKNRQVSVRVGRQEFIMEVLQTDAAINPGNSGGPLLNYKGEVIGVNTLKLVQDTIEGMGFAIPIEMAMSAAERLEQGKVIERPILGIEIIDVSDTFSLSLNRIVLDNVIEYGVVISRIEDGFPANESGLKPHDVIVSINGETVKNSAELRFVLYKYSIGETVEIEFFREGEHNVTNVLLDKGIN